MEQGQGILQASKDSSKGRSTWIPGGFSSPSLQESLSGLKLSPSSRSGQYTNSRQEGQGIVEIGTTMYICDPHSQNG